MKTIRRISILSICIGLTCLCILTPQKVSAALMMSADDLQVLINDKADNGGGTIEVNQAVKLSGTLELKAGTTTIINSLGGASNTGICFKGSSQIKGPGKLIIKAEVGIYTEGAFEISDGANVEIESTSYGLNTAVTFCDVSVQNASLKIKSGNTAMNIGDHLILDHATLTIESEKEGINTDGGISILNHSNVDINSKSNAIQSANGIRVQDSEVAIESAASGLANTSGPEFRVDNSIVDVALSGNGIGMINETYQTFVIDHSSVDIVGGGRGLESDDLQISNESLVNINNQDTLRVKSLLLEQSQMNVSGTTTVLQNQKWNSAANARINNVGTLTNNGEIEMLGVLYNDGRYRHNGTLSGSGRLLKGDHASVVIETAATPELKALLTQLGETTEMLFEGLDFVGDTSSRSGEGYVWDETLKTLTISNLVLHTNANEDDPSILLPDGAFVRIVPNTFNEVINTNAKGNAIEGMGDLTMYGQGIIRLESNNVALGTGGTLRVVGTTIHHVSNVGLAAQDVEMTYAKLVGVALAGANLAANNSIVVTSSQLDVTSIDQSFVRISTPQVTTRKASAIQIDGLASNVVEQTIVSEAGVYTILVDADSKDPIITSDVNTYVPGYLVRYIANNKALQQAQVAAKANEVITPLTFTNPGYDFVSWDVLEEEVSPFAFADGIHSDTVLYGKWKVTPPSPEPTPEPTPKPIKPTSPETADSSNSGLWIMSLLLSISVISTFVVKRGRLTKVKK